MIFPRYAKRTLFYRHLHSKKTWQEFCRIFRNGKTEIPFTKLKKLSLRIAGGRTKGN